MTDTSFNPSSQFHPSDVRRLRPDQLQLAFHTLLTLSVFEFGTQSAVQWWHDGSPSRIQQMLDTPDEAAAVLSEEIAAAAGAFDPVEPPAEAVTRQQAAARMRAMATTGDDLLPAARVVAGPVVPDVPTTLGGLCDLLNIDVHQVHATVEAREEQVFEAAGIYDRLRHPQAVSAHNSTGMRPTAVTEN